MYPLVVYPQCANISDFFWEPVNQRWSTSNAIIKTINYIGFKFTLKQKLYAESLCVLALICVATFMKQSFAYEKLTSRKLKNVNRDNKVSILVELSNQKEDFKVIIPLKSLRNAQYFGAEIIKIRVSPALISRYFTRINIRGDKLYLNQNLTFHKTRSRKLIQMIKTFS